MFGLNELFSQAGAGTAEFAHKKSPTARPDRASHDQQAPADFCEKCWQKWPRPEDWPPFLDALEAAAYLRISYWTILRLSIKGRDGRARLAHQRLGVAYRFRRATLDAYGQVQGRLK